MAVYKRGNYLSHNETSDAFDNLYGPGVAAPYAGIYRCLGCHREIGIAEGHILPPQTHHTNTTEQGGIRWQLIVWADHNPK